MSATLHYPSERLTQTLRKTDVARFDSVLMTGLAVVLMFGPLAFGAVEPWSLLILQLGAASLLLAWVIKQTITGEAVIETTRLYAPLAAFALVVVAQILFGATAYAYVTLSELMQFAAYGALLFVAVQCLRSEKVAKIWAWTLTAFGAALSIFAMIQGFTSNGKLYWIRPLRESGWIYGPYVNHNHYAGLMEMLVPFALVLAFSGRRGGNRGLAMFAALLIAVSIFLSGSRGGMLALAVELGLFFLFLSSGRSRNKLMVALAFLVVLAGFTFWLGDRSLLDRMATMKSGTGLTADMRLAITRDSWAMIRQRPLFGWGLGTFPTVYPRFRSFVADVFVNEAHNDFLQLLVETGIAGFTIALWFIVELYRAVPVCLRRWRRHGDGAIAVAAALGCTGILAHSFFDFNLHIPANAALFFVLCGIATRRFDESSGAVRKFRMSEARPSRQE